ncbi:MAG TPA: hypothetical protein VF950_09470 [Planctomycetota bacterium]
MASLILALLLQVPQPKIYATQPSGAKAGTSVELRLTSGAELERVDRLVFSHPGITAERLMRPADRLFPEPRPVDNTFKVAVAADVPPGVYELRAAGPYGVSNARRFAVGNRDEVFEKEPNDELAQATEVPFGATVGGVCDPQKFDVFRFTPKKGQRVIIEGAAMRLLSRAQLVLTVSDPSGRLLKRAAGTRSSDLMIDFTAEAEGPHALAVSDQTYKGGDEYFYRVTIGAGPWIDYVDPPALKAGAETPVTVYGRGLPGGQPAGVELDGRPLEKIQVAVKAPARAEELAIEAFTLPGDASADVFVWRWMSPSGASNPARFLLLDETATAEVEPNEDPEKASVLALPARVTGRLGRRGDKDWYSFEAKKGEKLWIEVTSQRLGLPADPILVLQQVSDKGVKELLETDDPAVNGQQRDAQKRYRLTPDDPGVLWTVPEDGKYRLLVRDLYGDTQGDARFAYVLSLRAAKPDFRLIAWPVEPFPAENRATPTACVLRRGGVERIRVFATRLEGFDGPIRLEVEGLPPGVTASPMILQGGDNVEEIPLQAAADAKAFAGTIRIVGKAGELARAARSAELAWPVMDQNTSPFVPRVAERIGLAVDVERPAPFTLVFGDPAATIKTARGAKLKVPVKLVKNGEYKDLEKAKITLKPQGLPGANNQKTIASKDVVIDAAAPTAEVELDVTDKAPLGLIAISLAGEVQISYVHEPARAKAVEEDRKRVEAVLKAAAEEAKAAEAARGKAAKEVEELKKKLAALKPDDAEKAAVETSLKEAGDRLKTAEEAEAKAKELAKAGDGMMKKLADDAKKAADMSKEKKLKIAVQSLAVTLDIAATPLAIKVSPVTVKAGDKAELAIEVERVAGFEEDVVFELSGGKLSLAEPGKCGKDQKTVKLLIAADKTAAEGETKATLKSQLKWNGKTIPFEQAITVKVEKAPPPPPEPPKEAPKAEAPKEPAKDAPKEPKK